MTIQNQKTADLHLHAPPLAHRILWTLLYETERLLTSYSVQQWILFDLRKEYRIRRRERQREKKKWDQLNSSLNYLRRAALVTRKNIRGQPVWYLTVKGRLQAIATAVFARKTRPTHHGPPVRYLVIFDIPEEQRRLRDLFRRILYTLNGKLIQKSVFLLQDREDYHLVRQTIKAARLKPHVIMAKVNILKY